MQRLDDVYIKVKGGLISKEQGARDMMAIVYENKTYFGLTNLSEDDLMDFLIYQLNQFSRVLDSYEPGKSRFTTYVMNNIHTNLSSWIKMAIRKGVRREIYFTTSESDMKNENFKLDLFPSPTEQDESQLHTLIDVMNFTKSQQPVKETSQSTSKKHRMNPVSSYNKTLELRRKCLLVLALKSSYYMDEELMKKVSILTDTPIDVLSEMFSKVMATLERKIRRRNACIRSRDNAYYFKKKYSFEKELLDPDSCWALAVNRKIEKHNENWQKKNRMLKENKFRIVPSNKFVGELLGIEERQISYLMKQAEKNMDTISLKHYYESHEDLSSNRKHE